MSRLTLQAVGPADGRLGAHELPLDEPGSRCRLRLYTLPGSRGLHLACALDGTCRWRFEVAAEGDERVTVDLELDDRRELHASSANRPVYTLPADERFAPLPPVRHQPGRQQLEVLFVVDGTARDAAEPSRPHLLGGDGWPRVVDQLVEIVAALGTGRTVRTGLLAFGDHTLAMLDAPDLQPAYRLWPPEAARGELSWFRPGELQARLLPLPESSGGDFVDALADALAACAHLPPHATARRVVVLFGDSPGHSLLDPAPDGADLLPRSQEIEGPLLRLHAMGTLLVTVFNDQGADSAPAWAPHRDLPEHARKQYAQIASTPGHAFVRSSFDPRRAAKAILRPPRLRGRGGSHGLVEAVLPLAEERIDLTS